MRAEADREIFQGNPMMANNLKTPSVKTNPPPARSATLSVNSDNPNVEEILGRYVALFDREGMKEVKDDVKGTEKQYMLGSVMLTFFSSSSSPQLPLGHLFAAYLPRLIENREWTGAEVLVLEKHINKIRTAWTKGKEDARLDEENIRRTYDKCMNAYNVMYEGAALIMQEETGWEQIIETCAKMSESIVPGLCLQSSTTTMNLYIHALEVEKMFHDAVFAAIERLNGMEKKLNNPELAEAFSGPMKQLSVVLVPPLARAIACSHVLLTPPPPSSRRRSRFLEKLINKTLGCAAIMDVVRAMVVCSSNLSICKVLETLQKDKSIIIYKVKESYSNHKHGQWVDVKVCPPPPLLLLLPLFSLSLSRGSF
jgi:hypothetical protein